MKTKLTLYALAVALLFALAVSTIAQGRISAARADKIDTLQSQLAAAQAAEAQSRARAQALQAEVERLNQAAAAQAAAVSAAIARNPSWASQALPADVAAALNQP
ncbi:hypothetical protein GJV52_00745 [Neisseria brasiliensis]|uniref:Uncharacterized protein n=1 Tax=Neisseria brasiliensis TaxID=2666100 RepID=A0A5Q3RW14_9NEIS|nr:MULTISPECIES: hypothetical protein [Neisseria]MRN37196.1 hypothetical protein [Neisseria brasiliensis]QGL24205.1 hypothetical protein GJV52_00745 [Neisseria brasiliensis]